MGASHNDGDPSTRNANAALVLQDGNAVAASQAFSQLPTTGLFVILIG